MRAVVTGGGGFLGLEIVRQLRARGDEVLSCSRARHLAVEALGARSQVADLADRAALERAFAGADVVFHVAAKAGVWGPRAEYERTNVLGTENVLAACRAARVRRLVHTSSPSVCFDGRDHVGATNELAYAERFLAHYPRTKAAAERAVLAANGQGGLATVALRPHLIVGPGDPHLVPRLLERARRGRLAQVGDGTNQVSLTDVTNAAHAHLCAADRLAPDAVHAGRAYFVAQAEPVSLWRWIRTVLARLGAPPIERRVPLAVAYAAGAACEALWRASALRGEPPMTRFVALQLARTHTYDLAPARRDLGYAEIVSLDEATERAVSAPAAPGG